MNVRNLAIASFLLSSVSAFSASAIASAKAAGSIRAKGVVPLKLKTLIQQRHSYTLFPVFVFPSLYRYRPKYRIYRSWLLFLIFISLMVSVFHMPNIDVRQQLL